MKLLAAFLCFAALPAGATQNAWLALYDVTGVALDDVLNIRERPTSDAPIIGSLHTDAKSVELIRPDDRLGWAMVNVEEGSGWVSLRYLKRQAGQWSGAMPQVAHCVGTEPFWSLDIEGDTLTYSSMGDVDQTYTVTQSGPAQGRRDRYHLIADRPSGMAVATLSTQACNDGMSSREFGLAVDLLLQDAPNWQHVSGCCSLSHK